MKKSAYTGKNVLYVFRERAKNTNRAGGTLRYLQGKCLLVKGIENATIFKSMKEAMETTGLSNYHLTRKLKRFEVRVHIELLWPEMPIRATLNLPASIITPTSQDL